MADRYAIFVDAGYLLAAGAELGAGVKNRAAIHCNYSELVAALTQETGNDCGLPLLRVYWYDAATQAIPTLEHLKVAELSNVKLRLGRLTGGHQKGVDSMIVRDLMVLARQRAMVTAYLVGGDEDLREGVVAAQDEGVRVLTIGIPTAATNQALTLLREADGHIVRDAAFWRPYFAPVAPVRMPLQLGVALEAAAEEGAAAFARDWRAKATAEDLQHLLGSRPIIPRMIDLQLLLHVEATCGSLRDRDGIKRLARASFWRIVEEGGKGGPGGEAGVDVGASSAEA